LCAHADEHAETNAIEGSIKFAAFFDLDGDDRSAMIASIFVIITSQLLGPFIANEMCNSGCSDALWLCLILFIFGPFMFIFAQTLIGKSALGR